MLASRPLALLALVTVAASSHAVVLNIGARLGQNPKEVTASEAFGSSSISVTRVGTVLSLAAGTYRVTPVKVGTPGALYTAANRFSAVNLPPRGWEWNVNVSTSLTGAGTKYGFGAGSPSIDDPYQATPDLAFAQAPAPFELTFTQNEDVFFYWFDDGFSDNEGGISVSVEAVPEPFTLALGAAGLAAAVRRRRARRG